MTNAMENKKQILIFIGILLISVIYDLEGNVMGNIDSQKTAVLLVNSQEYTNNSLSPPEVNDTIFGNINSYFKENSFDKTFLEGDVFGWYAIDVNSACDYNSILLKAVEAADPYVDFTQYKIFIIVFRPACNTWPAGGINWPVSFSTMDGEITSAYIMWIRNFNQLVIAHEFGHIFGLEDAGFLYCYNQPLDVVGPDGCSAIRYSDPYDTMSGSLAPGTLPHLNAYHKEKMGWLSSSNIVEANKGTYFINPLEVNTSGIQAVKIPVPGKNYAYYLEYRQPIGFDDGLHGNVYDGVLIHLAPFDLGGNTLGSVLIDTHPNTSDVTQELYDVALPVGESFLDFKNGINVTVLSKNASGVNVSIGTATSTAISLFKGWNIISSPIESPLTLSQIEASCSLDTYQGYKMYGYDPKTKNWTHPTEVKKDEGVYVLAKDSCNVSLSGTLAKFSSKSLFKGWNLFSTETSLDEIKEDCNIISNPSIWEWDAQNKKFVHPALTDKLNQGKGYWIAVEKDCVLKAAEEAPPVPSGLWESVKGFFSSIIDWFRGK